MADKTALDMRYLNVPLPEDLMKLKWGGDYERLISVIDRRLADETLPAPLRKRLQLERFWPPESRPSIHILMRRL